MNKYPKQNREISSILALTMAIAGFGAIPGGYMTAEKVGMPLDLWYAGAALVASLVLTPGMMLNSSFVKVFSQPWKKLVANVKKWFHRGDNLPPAAEVPAN